MTSTPNAPTATERADGSTPIRRAIAEVLQAAALHMIASPECARAVDRVVELHLAARREVERAIMEAIELTVKAIEQQENDGIPREAQAIDYAGILRAALAATPEGM